MVCHRCEGGFLGVWQGQGHTRENIATFTLSPEQLFAGVMKLLVALKQQQEEAAKLEAEEVGTGASR